MRKCDDILAPERNDEKDSDETDSEERHSDEKDSDEEDSSCLLCGILLCLFIILALLSLFFIFKEVRNKRRRQTKGLAVIEFSAINGRFDVLE